MKVLVTGNTGFIGSHLVKKLESLGHEVSGINSKKCDIRNYECVRRIVRENDIVFHLAGMSRVSYAEDHDKMAYDVIYRGSENIYMACRQFNAKVVFASSRCVYGETQVPTSEGQPLVPIGWYGNYKMLSENLFNDGDMVLRLSNVYGPHKRCHSVINRFIEMVQLGQSIPVFSNLDVTRDFVFIDDVVDAFLLGFDNYGVFNIGGGCCYSLKQVLDVISDVLGKEYHTIDMKRKKKEIQNVFLDIKKSNMLLGWSPKVSLKEGIKRCVDVQNNS